MSFWGFVDVFRPDVVFDPDPVLSRRGGSQMYSLHPAYGGVRRGRDGDDDYFYDRVAVLPEGCDSTAGGG